MELSAESASGIHYLYTESVWTGKKNLIVEGKQTVKLGKKKFCLDDENGERTEYNIVGSYISGVKVVTSGGEETVLAKNKWYDWLMAIIPLLGIPFGVAFCGAIGGGLSALFCLLGAVINISVSRSKLALPLKIVIQIFVAAVVNAIWFGLWYIIAVFVLSLIN